MSELNIKGIWLSRAILDIAELNIKEIESREIIPIAEKVNGYCSKEQEGMVKKDTLPIGENAKDINSNINNNYRKIIQLNNKFVSYQNQRYADLDWNKFYMN